MTMLKRLFVSTLAVMAMALLIPAEAQAQLGKGGGDKGGGKGGGKEEPPKKGGDEKGGGKSTGGSKPPTKSGGGGQSGGGSKPPTRGDDKGGGKSDPPSKGGGGSKPPTRGDDKGGGGQSGGGGLGKGGSTGGGGGQTGGGTKPPTQGGGSGQTGGTKPPTKGGGSGQTGGTKPPTQGGGQSGGGGLGKGGSTSGGGGSQPPTRGGGSGGYQGGGSQPPTRGGGQSGGQSGGSGGLGKGSTGGNDGYQGGGNQQGGTRSMPPTRGQRDNQVFSKNGVFDKGGSGRTGGTNYGTTRNEIRRSSAPSRIPDAPLFPRGNGRDRDVFREDRTVVHNRYRQGYCHYSNNWVDDWFYYPHYAFDYRPGYCYPSPFYYYHHVPGYIASIRVVVGDFRFVIHARERYEWRRPYNYGGYNTGYNRYDRIDYSIDNLVSAFERSDMYFVENMVPRSGYVDVALEDENGYRMYSDDFFDMLRDIVEGTDTRSYRVREVRYDRGQYVVYAEHEFRDPWGRSDRKYHTIVLEPDREGYEIKYFRVDRSPSW
jgi:hypothetical protein